MRGKVRRCRFSSMPDRITPAYAGKRLKLFCKAVGPGDHPRLCGEKLRGVQGCRRTSGSPPPMRGKGFAAGVLMPACGITPAYAGKSPVPPSLTRVVKDHPRLCGEKPSIRPYPKLNLGSPPPMRGKDNCSGQVFQLPGITPAYAGKRFSDGYGFFSGWDHPRLCGEKFRIHSFITCQPGSPPPMRGKAPKNGILRSAIGITPAYAGKRNTKKITTRSY